MECILCHTGLVLKGRSVVSTVWWQDQQTLRISSHTRSTSSVWAPVDVKLKPSFPLCCCFLCTSLQASASVQANTHLHSISMDLCSNVEELGYTGNPGVMVPTSTMPRSRRHSFGSYLFSASCLSEHVCCPGPKWPWFINNKFGKYLSIPFVRDRAYIKETLRFIRIGELILWVWTSFLSVIVNQMKNHMCLADKGNWLYCKWL